MENMRKAIEPLFVADPELGRNVSARLEKKGKASSVGDLEMLVEESFRAMDREISFGYATALGFAEILGGGKREQAGVFRDLIRLFSKEGPTLGLEMAQHLPPVLVASDPALKSKFLSSVDIMRAKGTYILKRVLSASSELLRAGEEAAADAYLELVSDTFSQDVTYNQCLHLSHMLPDAVRSFPSEERPWLIPLFSEVIRSRIILAEPFLEGIEKGLGLLSPKALSRFVSEGLEKLERSEKAAAGFLSLRSRLGLSRFRSMQVNVPFSQARSSLDRYLRARTGMPLSARPVSEAPKKFLENIDARLCAASDGRFIYLPERAALFESLDENMFLYKCLARLEAGLYEFGTFDFDLERWEGFPGFSLFKENTDRWDLDVFLGSFGNRALAEDLFTVFEHGRVRYLTRRRYPGMARRAEPVVKSQMLRILSSQDEISPVAYLYARIGAGLEDVPSSGQEDAEALENMAAAFDKKISENPAAESCASLVAEFYPFFEKRAGGSRSAPDGGAEAAPDEYRPFRAPFDRKIRPRMYFNVFGRFEEMARSIKRRLEARDVNVYQSDLRKKLVENNGRLSREDVNDLLDAHGGQGPGCDGPDSDRVDFSGLDLSDILDDRGGSYAPERDADGEVFRYREWDCRIGDYINDHVRVLDRQVPQIPGDFYEQTLRRHRGLVGGIRYAFELLKPQGLKILKPWTEGDAFDYRALIDYAIDKKAGWMPSDRLYVKRLKQQRDVAVLLLTDLSKSTSNLVFESDQTVLDVEKEAIVLFCEALEVLGDKSAIAGFSGTGRLGVDYFRIKDFEEPLDDSVKARINAMSPQRSTRMGAAIRHAAARLEKTEALVRILLLLGDGFPNDQDYKRQYAMEDTRKAAAEAFSKNIAFRAITVNIVGDSRLDDLYGNVRHSVISDVRQLPDKLLRIYSALTRC